MTAYDIHFSFDPVCPFAWLTSRWVEQVCEQRDYSVDWRFISLRILNKRVDYDSHFPPEYEAGHTAGLKLLRVCARARAEHGREVMGPLYGAMGASLFDVAPPEDPDADRALRATSATVVPLLERVGLSAGLADALEDESWDAEIEAETEAALSRTGRDVGTPIIHFEPPDGVAFFGPVISRLPSADRAVELWDHVIALAGFPGFAEMKRSLRELPQLRVLGVEPGEAGVEQDWRAGSRRLEE
jgi:2-hydroxychromene-2-carboxylate isomerase